MAVGEKSSPRAKSTGGLELFDSTRNLHNACDVVLSHIHVRSPVRQYDYRAVLCFGLCILNSGARPSDQGWIPPKRHPQIQRCLKTFLLIGRKDCLKMGGTMVQELNSSSRDLFHATEDEPASQQLRTVRKCGYGDFTLTPAILAESQVTLRTHLDQ